MERKKESFTGTLGFILTAAGSAVGLGNIWRFPYLAAKDGGGLFILVYIILAISFGFALMATEIAIGRKTGRSPLTAYKQLDKKFGFIGPLAVLASILILPYYCVIGGWVTKYTASFVTGQISSGLGVDTTAFFNDFISSTYSPIIWFMVFLILSTVVVAFGVEKGIEKMSKIIMPSLVVLIVAIAIYALTLSYTDPDTGVTRTALDGLKIYLIPDFSNISFEQIIGVISDASSQMFYSMSIAMGILIAYGSYARKDSNLLSSVSKIEIFDTGIALLAGLIIIPAVFTFNGQEGLSAAGPSLLFISMPEIFNQMGFAGTIVGALFFFMVLFAALTSSISIMEAIVTSIIDKFKITRIKATLMVFFGAVVVGVVVCLGYNVLFLNIPLPNGSTGQILDLLDFIANSIILPLVALSTCILIGWVYKPNGIIDELKLGIGEKSFKREKLYYFMIRYGAPVLLIAILLQAFGVL